MLTSTPSTGNFVGPLAFKAEDAPRYAPGFIITLITAIVAAVLVVVYRLVCIWENRRRDKAGTPEGFDHAYEDDITDRKVSKRSSGGLKVFRADVDVFRTRNSGISSNQELCGFMGWLASGNGKGHGFTSRGLGDALAPGQRDVKWHAGVFCIEISRSGI
jgi:hypothetical protein